MGGTGDEVDGGVPIRPEGVICLERPGQARGERKYMALADCSVVDFRSECGFVW